MDSCSCIEVLTIKLNVGFASSSAATVIFCITKLYIVIQFTGPGAFRPNSVDIYF